ncbi:DUF6009 family protein (plasmid) [Streptomyces sp. Qhu-G9]|uniref:DUF6009 family protein n=1 Tax=Streptomyces sp. Qhu-G9 TaxID=3452799 RepID=UPI0022ABCE44|nr:DUF6009 family protein [Streptomyces aurantiacus]WAU78365.1 DUF6009 family protein [Streptomyces aurantiacus]
MGGTHFEETGGSGHDRCHRWRQPAGHHDTCRSHRQLACLRHHEPDHLHHLPAPNIPAARPVPPRAQQAVRAAGGGRDRIQHSLAAILAPVEAVDPRTLTARVTGYKTERSEGGPPSTALQELGITLPL